jgi:hypothetical protein
VGPRAGLIVVEKRKILSIKPLNPDSITENALEQHDNKIGSDLLNFRNRIQKLVTLFSAREIDLCVGFVNKELLIHFIISSHKQTVQ